MIVQCEKCGTKFRFDESLIDEKGNWVRCSRCSHVFLLDKPASGKAAAQSDRVFFSEDSHESLHKKEPLPVETNPAQEVLQESQTSEHKGMQAVSVQTDSFEDIRIRENDTDAGDSVEEDMDDVDRELLNIGDLKEEKEDKEQRDESKAATTRSRLKQLIYISVLLVLVGIYLWFFFEIGNQVADMISAAVSTVTEKIQGTTATPEGDGPAQVHLSDIRQRFVGNLQIGNLRVIEGIAGNLSDHPMTRIKIRAELVGDNGIMLGEMESYCGNLLTEEELASMTEEQILKELSNSQGSDVSNDRIAPKEQIPFMVVFTREPPGVTKTFITPAGAERLLP